MVDSFVTIEEWAQRVLQFERENNLQIYMRTGDPALKQTRSNTGTSDIAEYAKNGIYLAVESVPREVNIGLVKIEQYMRPDDDPRQANRPYWQYTENCPTLEHQMGRLRWATYASKKLEQENAPKGTIHKKDDDAPDSLRYFMTLMPDLKFSTVGEKAPQSNLLNATSMAGQFNFDQMNYTDGIPADHLESSSIYTTFESNYGMEN
jgi:hypothetical protein